MVRKHQTHRMVAVLMIMYFTVFTELSNDPFDDFNIPFRLPYGRDDKFRGREEILHQMDGRLRNASEETQRRAVVLYGTGGAGKTEIAVEYAYIHRTKYNSIFWIDCSSQSEIYRHFWKAADRLVKHYQQVHKGQKSYIEIAARLRLVNLIDDNGSLSTESQHAGQIVDAVKEWISNNQNHQWLLVFDNYDDIDSFTLQDYVPESPQGSIIITGRRRDLNIISFEIEVEEMSMEEALEVFVAAARLSEERRVEGKVPQVLLR